MFFISSTKFIFTKLLSVSERLIKIKIRSQWALFSILLPSAVIHKQWLSYGNEILQYLQNCKCYNVEQDHFRKPLWRCTSFVKRYLQRICTIFKNRSILGCFQRLNCHNFPLILTKVVKLHFLESTFKCLKAGQK